MTVFRLKADVTFEAADILDAFKRISEHYADLATEEPALPTIYTNGEISIEPVPLVSQSLNKEDNLYKETRFPSQRKKLTTVDKVNIIRLMNSIRKRIQRRYAAFTENTPIMLWFAIAEEECKNLPVTVNVESGKEPGQTIVVKHNESPATLRIMIRLDENDAVQSEFYDVTGTR